MDKTGRNGLRVGDLLKEDFIELYNNLKKKHINILKQYDYNYNIEENEESWFRGVDEIRSFKIVDSEYEINKYLSLGKNILAEGARGQCWTLILVHILL
jgi:adenylosuccinate synthase